MRTWAASPIHFIFFIPNPKIFAFFLCFENDITKNMYK